jgi:hypothetical protein
MVRQEQRYVQKAEEVPSPAADLLARASLLAEMVKGLVSTLHSHRIYLFGSRARGGAGPDSGYAGCKRRRMCSCGPAQSSRAGCTYQPQSCARGSCSMPLDLQEVADTRVWLHRALEDLGSAEVPASPNVGFTGTAVFHPFTPRGG